MTVKVKVGYEPPHLSPNPQAIALMDIRKTVDGNYIIYDHPDMDIAVLTKLYKVISFPKDEMGDHIYAAQSRLFEFLERRGAVALGSIQAGNVYHSLEAAIPTVATDPKIEPLQVVIYTISKFLDEEQPYYNEQKQYEEELEQWLLEPDEEDSTELGEIPHRTRKGSINRWPGSNAAFGMTGMYRA